MTTIFWCVSNLKITFKLSDRRLRRSFGCFSTKSSISKCSWPNFDGLTLCVSFCRKILLMAKKETFRLLKTIFSVMWFRCLGSQWKARFLGISIRFSMIRKTEWFIFYGANIIEFLKNTNFIKKAAFSHEKAAFWLFSKPDIVSLFSPNFIPPQYSEPFSGFNA